MNMARGIGLFKKAKVLPMQERSRNTEIMIRAPNMLEKHNNEHEQGQDRHSVDRKNNACKCIWVNFRRLAGNTITKQVEKEVENPNL